MQIKICTNYTVVKVHENGIFFEVKCSLDDHKVFPDLQQTVSLSPVSLSPVAPVLVFLSPDAPAPVVPASVAPTCVNTPLSLTNTCKHTKNTSVHGREI